MPLMLGKKPFVPNTNDFILRSAFPGIEFPKAPKRFGHGFMYHGKWGMLANDKAGDCVEAGFAHQAMISSKLGGAAESFDDKGVLKVYSEITGYNPADPSTDQGTSVREALSYWRKTGILTSDGERHKIGAYVQIMPNDWEKLMSAAFVFSSVGIGWNVPSTIWDQWDNKEPFDIVDENAPIEGGHYTLVTGRTGMTIGGMVTWGARKSFTKEFYEHYNDETWAIVFPDEIKKGKNERGFDLGQLNELLENLAR